ncbi:PilT/PilU family type 4a pilus ATPase [bacterium]|nr:PilT/PilU family type 4a pilus ATPase [bacterium]
MARKPRSKDEDGIVDASSMTLEERVARIESDMEDIENVPREMFKLQGRFERLSKDFDEIAEGASAEDLEQVQKGLDELGERFKAVEDSLSAKSAEISASEEKILGEINEINAAQTAVKDSVASLDASVNERLDSLKKEISSAPEFAKKDDLENFKLEQGIASEALEERVKSDIEALKNEVQVGVKDGLKALEEKVETKVKESESGITSVDEALKELRGRFEALCESLNGADNVADKLKATDEALDNLKVRIDAFAPRFEEAIAQAEDSRNKVEEHLKAIDMAMRLVEQLDARVSDIGKNAEAVSAAAANAIEAAPKIAASVQAAVGSAAAAAPAAAPAAPAEVVEDVPIPAVSESLGYELGDILQVVINHGASDLHLQAGTTPTVRLNGDLIPVGETKLAKDDTKALVYPAMTREQRAAVSKGKEVSFVHITAEGTRFIVNAFLERGNLSANFHMLRTEVQPFEELGLPPVLKKLALFQNGLLVFTGLTGCGKSATVAAIVDFINNNRKCHIVTVEEPIEYYHNNINSLITQREVGTDTASFKDGISMAMRQDPDVLVIGDVKDSETMMSAVTAAEKGYLVICVMNAPDTVQAVRRMVAMFSGENQRQFKLLLTAGLRGIVSQKLINRADDKGRIPAVEVLVGTADVASMIMVDDFEGISAYLQQGGIEGMQSFNQSVEALYSQGLIVKEDDFREDVVVEEPEFIHEPEDHGNANAVSIDDPLIEWL